MRWLALILLSACLQGCTVPLGPGFNQPYRAVDVTATSLEPPRIHVQVADRLENDGDRSLSYLDVVLPGGPSFGTRDVSATVGGHSVSIVRVTRESGPSLRIPFDPPWPQKQEREIGVTYDLDPAPEGRGVVAAASDGFYLADPTVFPSWLPPVGPFARSSLRAATEELDIAVPADFHVLAGGREQGSQRRGAFLVHRFQTLGAEFPPYLIAGRYQERRTDTGHGAAIFWTRDPLNEETARAAAERLTSTFVIYQNLFGRVMRNPFPIHIAETSAELAPIIVATRNISAASFPGGVLLDQRAVALGIASDPVLDLADYELARTWFGWHVRPRAEVDLLLGRGMALFAAVHADESRRRGNGIRQQQIARLIATYDGFGPRAGEKPGFGPVVGYTRAQMSANSYKGALFLFALEDIAGEEKLHRAVRRVLAAMAGQEIGGDEFRSAVEAESGRNLAGEFHAWSDRPGIPPEFRARYAAVH